MPAIKCVVVGDTCVGKTPIIRAYCTKQYVNEDIPTVFDEYEVDVKMNDKFIHLLIHDTGGYDSYDELRQTLYPQTWIPEIRHHCPKTPFVLVGTKLDLRETCDDVEKRKSEFISFKEGVSVAKRIGAVKYLECSAKSQEGIELVFEEAIKAAAVINPGRSAVYEAIRAVVNRIRPDAGVQQPDQDNALSGIKDETTFKSLLSYWEYESYGNRIYLAGACNVCKSTLASLLIGDKIPLKWDSTDGLRIFFGRNGIDVKNRKMIPLKKRKCFNIR